MHRTIGVIAEDNSDVDVVVNLIGKYIEKGTFSVKKFVGNGCGKIKQKCDSWANNLLQRGCDHVFLFHDLDKNNEQKLYSTLEKKIPAHKYPNALIVIPKEELEAWLLADGNAIKTALNLPQIPKIKGDVERINSPKEFLQKIVWDTGKKKYVNTVHNKKISELIPIQNLKQCESYKNFDTYLLDRVCTGKERNTLKKLAK